MHFAMKPDYELTLPRYNAFFAGEVADRPAVSIRLPVERPQPIPTKGYDTLAERWLDIDFRALCMDLAMENTRFLADALPVAWPNLGPEIFSAWCGCGYEYGEDTTWSEPCLEDWADMGRCRFNPEHPLFKTMMAFYDRLIERAKGRYIVGLTDLHPGGDHLAALRDPQRLCFDMIEHVDEIKAALKLAQEDYYAAYDLQYNKLRAAGMPITAWIEAPWQGRYYIPSNDFSCMISPAAFEDVFLPGIAEECAFYERSVYHLDGPGALRHLDALLSIPQLSGIQWVPGAGREGFPRWVDVYQRIQKGRKGIYLTCHVRDLDLVFESLRPDGVWFAHIGGIGDEETAGRVLKRIADWK